MEQENALHSARGNKGSRLESIVNTVLLSDGKTKETLGGSALSLNGNLASIKTAQAGSSQRKKFGWIEGEFFKECRDLIIDLLKE
jgi:hypothetical protein